MLSMMNNISPRVLIVGSGISGSFLASKLTQSKCQVTIWDKARAPGGRMTSYKPRDFKAGLSVDLGAQYLTLTSEIKPQLKAFYEKLESNRVIKPLKGKILGHRSSDPDSQNFIIPGGASSLAEYFLKNSPNLRIEYSTKCISLKQKSDYSWLVRSDKIQIEEEFDIVVLTVPVPQVLELEVSDDLKERLKSSLEDIGYNSRFVYCYFYDYKVSLPGFENPEIIAKYIDDDTIRFVSIDTRKRELNSDFCSVLFHTNVKFGLEYREKTKEEVEPILLSKIKERFSDWPSPSSVKIHKWKYSQVTKGYSSLAPGFLKTGQNYSLFVTGDAFSQPHNVNGAIISALKTSDYITSSIE